MRRSSLLFLIFIAAIISLVALIPLLFDSNKSNPLTAYSNGPSSMSINSENIKAIVSDIPELDLEIVVDSAATQLTVESLINACSIEYQDSTSTLFISRGKEYPSDCYNMISVTIPPSAELSIVKGIVTGQLRLRFITTPSLVVAPCPINFDASGCDIGTLVMSRPEETDKTIHLKLNSCSVPAFISAVTTSEMNMEVYNTSIGSFLTASPTVSAAQ